MVTVEPEVVHSFRNAGEDEAHFVTEVTPALGFESFLETMFGLAADGKTSKRGMPNPLRLAVIAYAHFDLVRLPYVPRFMQKAALAVGAAVGRAVGYESSYEPSGTPRPGDLVGLSMNGGRGERSPRPLHCPQGARSSGDRALPCGGRGRMFESCRAHPRVPHGSGEPEESVVGNLVADVRERETGDGARHAPDHLPLPDEVDARLGGVDLENPETTVRMAAVVQPRDRLLPREAALRE